MCGLAGMVALERALPPTARGTVEAMTCSLEHRGPDDAGEWADDRVALGHRRLSILDLSEAGRQPMVSTSGRFVLVFNGEIYNHRELRASLTSTGWRPKSTSDTEVILAGIEAWGFDRFLNQADGMFALALYDRSESTLALARDRFGEKPLVYCERDGHLLFASELTAFEHAPGLDLRLDEASTNDYFRYGYVPGRSTIYQGIHRVPPATVVEYRVGSGDDPKTWRYWNLPGLTTTEPATGERLEELLSASVRRQLVADRPVGAFLSGGIDSSLICAIAAQHTGQLTTFNMGWDVADHDESDQAAAVAAALGTDHHAVSLSRSDAITAVERLPQVMDEPFADPSQLSVLLVASMARQHVVVALSGDGGDELFAGYNRHRWLLKVRALQRRVPAAVRTRTGGMAHRAAPSLEALLRPVPTTLRPRLVADKARKLARVVAAATTADAYQTLLALTSEVGRPVEVPAEIEHALASDDPDVVLWGLRCADLTGWLPDDVLTKVDRATMAVSLESRAPFLQPDIAALALSLGVDELLARSGGKQPLRHLLDRLLPDVDFSQKKTGFGMPADSLLRDELADALGDAVASHRARVSPIEIDWAALHTGFRGGDDAPAPLLWSLLMFELWAGREGRQVTWA